MGDHMHEHLLARHAAGSTVRKREIDGFRQLVAIKRAHVIDILAEVAGVSVGSLYQYFPCKEAIVAALIDRHNQEIMQAVQGELEETANLPMEQAVRKLVAVAVRAHRIDPKLHRVLAEQIPRVGRLEKVETFNRQNYAPFAAYLEHHRDEICSVDLGLAAFVCVTSIEALTRTAVLNHKIVSDQAMEALVEEATRIVVGYLTH